MKNTPEQNIPQIHTCDQMELDGRTSVNDEVAGMFAAGGDGSNADSDVNVMRPTRIVRTTIFSDDDEPSHPPNTISVVDDTAPQDADNPCEYSPFHLLYHCFCDWSTLQLRFSLCLCVQTYH